MTFVHNEPYDSGMLDVGDGHRIAWSVSGKPGGKPAVVLHGGPGTGCSPRLRRWFDPSAYRVVLFDQRNSGNSTPHASEPVVDLSTNTTAHLLADIEQLREHLGIDRWLVWGGSWGSTLGLAYAEGHPDRVTEMILVSVVTTTHREVDWVTRAMGRVFPEQWARFRDGVPPGDRDGNLAAAYSRLLHDDDPAVRERAALRWCEWEDTHVATVPGYEHDERYDDPRFRLCFARLVTHYWANAAFLEDGQLMRDAARLAGIPGVLITGQLDVSGPPDIAWELARRWPGADLVIVEDAGHGARGRSIEDEIVAATTRFAR
ncbi:MAG TPA: prolyl aminopeptidase [Acidimicrobiales bacterium]|nr:prolyl aminopeptidase [Acidimicrobiales bacterium]